MSAYNFDADKCLQVLHGQLKEIPSGLSTEIWTNLVSRVKADKGVTKIVDFIIKSAEEEHDDDYFNKKLDLFWQENDIQEKMTALKNLVAPCPDTSRSWTPTTGRENINSVMGTHLSIRKEQWLTEISNIDEEIKSTKDILNSHINLLSEFRQTLDAESSKVADKLL